MGVPIERFALSAEELVRAFAVLTKAFEKAGPIIDALSRRLLPRWRRRQLRLHSWMGRSMPGLYSLRPTRRLRIWAERAARGVLEP